MSLDEAYLDITDYLKSHPDRTASEVVAELRQRITDRTQLTASAGIACNSMLAKVPLIVCFKSLVYLSMLTDIHETLDFRFARMSTNQTASLSWNQTFRRFSASMLLMCTLQFEFGLMMFWLAENSSIHYLSAKFLELVVFVRRSSKIITVIFSAISVEIIYRLDFHCLFADAEWVWYSLLRFDSREGKSGAEIIQRVNVDLLIGSFGWMWWADCTSFFCWRFLVWFFKFIWVFFWWADLRYMRKTMWWQVANRFPAIAPSASCSALSRIWSKNLSILPRTWLMIVEVSLCICIFSKVIGSQSQWIWFVLSDARVQAKNISIKIKFASFLVKQKSITLARFVSHTNILFLYLQVTQVIDM